MAIALDVSTPSAVFGTANPVTSAPIIAPAGSMFFAICLADSLNTFVISNPSGSALTWTAISPPVGDAVNMTVQVFWAYDPVGGSRTVRSTRSGSFTAHGLKVLVFTGTETTYTGAFNSGFTNTVNVVTTGNNSWVWAGHGDENGSLNTAAASCAFNDGPTTFGGVAGGIVKRSATTATSGTSVTIGTSGATSPIIFGFEVKEGAGGPAAPTGNALAGRWPNALAPGFSRRNVKAPFNTPFQLLGDRTAITQVDYVKSTSDPVGVTDTTANARGTAASDGVGLTDSVRVTRTTAVTDLVGITDTRSESDTEGQTDPIGITDSATRTVAAVRSPADPVGVTDTRTAARGKSQSDAVGITDSATGVISLTKTINDPVGVTDSLTKSRAESSGDGVGLTDAVSVTKNVVRTVSDAVGVTDTRAYNDGENYTDPLPITDTRSINRGTSRSDPVGITDARSVAVGRVRTDAVAITDTRAVARGKLVGDGVGVTDAATPARSIHVTITDPVGVTDFIPTGIVRDICVSLAGGPRVRTRALTGPRLASHTLTGPAIDRDVTGPAGTSLNVESLGARARTVAGPRKRSRAVGGPGLRSLVTSEGIQPRTVDGPRSC